MKTIRENFGKKAFQTSIYVTFRRSCPKLTLESPPLSYLWNNCKKKSALNKINKKPKNFFVTRHLTFEP